MKDTPDLARIATLVGDPARASMLDALMNGGALTASELALEAGVTLPTASSHLAKLTEGGLTKVASQGRHRYYALSGAQVAAMLESIAGVAAAVGPKRVRPGPRDGALRQARVCYDHLAGDHGVAMLDGFVARGLIDGDDAGLAVTAKGDAFFRALGVDMDRLARSRRPVCRACLDWSVRRTHLAGGLGAALYELMLERRWARRDPQSRAVIFSPSGANAFRRDFLAA